MASGKAVGYIRVSTEEQNDERQLDGVQLDKVFREVCSGKDRKRRPQLDAMLNYLREGDTLYVHALDRLARNLGDLLDMVRKLIEDGVSVVFVGNGLTFSGNASATDKLMLGMLGAVAQFERDMLRERQAEGIAKAKQRGVYKGRAPSLDEAGIKRLREVVATGKPLAAIARDFKISRSTVYKYLGTAPATTL